MVWLSVCVVGILVPLVAPQVVLQGGTASALITTDGRLDLTLAGASSIAVSCKLDAASEVDDSGTVLSSAGFSHSIAISTATALSFGGISVAASGAVQAQAVVSDTPSAVLPGTSATVRNQYLVFQTDGSISPEGSTGLTTSVVNGSAEIVTTVSNWPWCSTTGIGSAICLVGGQRKAGAYIDLDFTFATTNTAKLVYESSAQVEFAVGGGASVILSKRATIDGQLVSIAQGYPMITANSESSLQVRARLPRPSSGSGSLRYDPILKGSGGGSSQTRIIAAGSGQVSINSAGRVLHQPIATSASGSASMRMAGVAELDASGSTLTTLAGTVKQFSVAATATATFGIGPVRSQASFGVQADAVVATTTAWNAATLAQSFIVFRVAATVQPEGSSGFEATVSNGTVKSSLEVSNWPYCGSGGSPLKACNGEGAYLEVEYALETQTTATLAAETALSRTYAIGGGISVVFSKRARVDGQWQSMPSGFPKLKAGATTSTTATVVIRIPKPTNPTAKVTYDPVMTNSGAAPTSASQPLPTIGALLVVVIAVWGAVSNAQS